MFLFHCVTPYIWYQIFDSSFGRFLSSAEFKVQMDPISIFYVRYHRTASSVDHYPTNRDVHHEWFAHDLCCELQPTEEHTSTYDIANHLLFTEFSPKLKEKKISVLSQLSPILAQEKLILYIQVAHPYSVPQRDWGPAPASAMLTTVQPQLSPLSPGRNTLFSGLVPNCSFWCINL